jgi:hypothetical protein
LSWKFYKQLFLLEKKHLSFWLDYAKFIFKSKYKIEARWLPLMLAILAIREAEIRRIEAQGQPGPIDS